MLLEWQKKGHQITHLNRYGNIKIWDLDYVILQHMVTVIMHVPSMLWLTVNMFRKYLLIQYVRFSGSQLFNSLSNILPGLIKSNP